MILEPIYLYCERAGPGIWEEPLNLIAGLTFLPVALWIWQNAGGLLVMRILAAAGFALFLGGIYLHTYPSLLAVAVNVAPILVIVLVYFYAVNSEFLGLSPMIAVVCTLLILPFALVSLPLVALLKGAAASSGYVVIPVLLLGYAAVLRQDRPQLARGLFLAGAIMAAGVAVRALDMPLCRGWPHGTYFLWILAMNLLLFHLARVYRGQMLAGPDRGR